MTDFLSLGGDVIYASEQFLRGDDGDNLAPIDDYVVLDLHTKIIVSTRRSGPGWTTHLIPAMRPAGPKFNAFADPIAVERFLAPGAPCAWVGVRLRF